jgi:RNA recognition motif-containing protein
VFEGKGHEVVSCQVVMDRDTGRSRGFGCVELETKQAADAAIADIDGFDLDGRPLRISEARERTPRSGGGGGGGGGGGHGGGRGGGGGGRGGGRGGGGGGGGRY